ncbi:MAG: (d)CMP kinase [Nitrospirae bacterium]|nr:(d)CMP kinase [Nitrospirota bacterium]MBF0542030.1 (d)CMP kinase [Nitrospirota bacterium]
MKKVIAIDGPSGAGKSTIAKHIADLTGFSFLDTGALYRAIAVGLLNYELDEDSGLTKITETLKKLSIKYENGSVILNGIDVSKEIREERISHYSSVFSALKPVRDFLLEVQRQCAKDSNIVAEGRDMTTVVFPTADMKFFLTATPKIRALRRFEQIKDDYSNVTLEQIEKDIIIRDQRDMERDVAPLKQAQDAILIDSSANSIEQTVEQIMKEIKNKGI